VREDQQLACRCRIEHGGDLGSAHHVAHRRVQVLPEPAPGPLVCDALGQRIASRHIGIAQAVHPFITVRSVPVATSAAAYPPAEAPMDTVG